ncbi:MAG: hypothetical protein ACE5GE_02315 [Phycisphaerae bacterium]
MVGVGSARCNSSFGPGRWLPVVAVLVAMAGCSKPGKTQQWGQWQYREGDVQTPSQQLQNQQALQVDSQSLSSFDRPVQRPMFSQTMSESQRRAFQKRHARQMRERAEAQIRDAQARRRQALEAQQSFQPGGQP